MKITFPHTIENCIGEKLIFHGIEKEDGIDKLLVENYVIPGIGPVMHTHWLQDESLTVVSGRIGYQVYGQAKQYATAGETVLFKRGIAHRFWNDGKDILHCKGYIKPANTAAFFLTALFAAQNKSGKEQPERFDGAFLLKCYAGEYDIPGIPTFVKRIIIPITYYIGLLLGKYEHFKDAPAPLKN